MLLAAVLGTALAYMSDDMLNLAIPSVARDLHATAAGVQWILNAYYIPLVSFVLVAGSVGDILSDRDLTHGERWRSEPFDAEAAIMSGTGRYELRRGRGGPQGTRPPPTAATYASWRGLRTRSS